MGPRRSDSLMPRNSVHASSPMEPYHLRGYPPHSPGTASKPPHGSWAGLYLVEAIAKLAQQLMTSAFGTVSGSASQLCLGPLLPVPLIGKDKKQLWGFPYQTQLCPWQGCPPRETSSRALPAGRGRVHEHTALLADSPAAGRAAWRRSRAAASRCRLS